MPNVHKLLQKNAIEYEDITAGEFKRTVSVLGEITPAGREHFRGKLDAIHAAFKAHVADAGLKADIAQRGDRRYLAGERRPRRSVSSTRSRPATSFSFAPATPLASTRSSGRRERRRCSSLWAGSARQLGRRWTSRSRRFREARADPRSGLEPTGDAAGRAVSLRRGAETEPLVSRPGRRRIGLTGACLARREGELCDQMRTARWAIFAVLCASSLAFAPLSPRAEDAPSVGHGCPDQPEQHRADDRHGAASGRQSVRRTAQRQTASEHALGCRGHRALQAAVEYEFGIPAPLLGTSKQNGRPDRQADPRPAQPQKAITAPRFIRRLFSPAPPRRHDPRPKLHSRCSCTGTWQAIESSVSCTRSPTTKQYAQPVRDGKPLLAYTNLPRYGPDKTMNYRRTPARPDHPRSWKTRLTLS